MSSCHTHMLIGATAGLALARLVAPLPMALSATVPTALPTIILALGSALLATWPDIDEPGSWIARRARVGITLVATPLVGLLGWSLASAGALPLAPLTAALLAALLGMVFIGPVLGWLLLRAIRLGAGGHRRLTHSLLLAAGLAALALVLRQLAQPLWVLPAALAWGIVIHNLGDVVTPAGVALVWPLSGRALQLLPRTLAPFGEALIALVALGLGGLMLWTR